MLNKCQTQTIACMSRVEHNVRNVLVLGKPELCPRYGIPSDFLKQCGEVLSRYASYTYI